LFSPYSTRGVASINVAEYVGSVVDFVRAVPQVRAVEILNECYGTWFWGNSSSSYANAVAYAKLLRAVHSALHSAFGARRPRILACYDTNDVYNQAAEKWESGVSWGNQVWAADPHVSTYCDGVVVHPYGGDSSRAASALGNRAMVIKSHQDTGLPVYITEVGWPTGTWLPATSDSFEWTEQEQAQNVEQFMAWANSQPYVAAVFYFQYRDYTGMFYGIERIANQDGVDGSHKPAFKMLLQAAQQYNGEHVLTAPSPALRARLYHASLVKVIRAHLNVLRGTAHRVSPSRVGPHRQRS